LPSRCLLNKSVGGWNFDIAAQEFGQQCVTQTSQATILADIHVDPFETANGAELLSELRSPAVYRVLNRRTASRIVLPPKHVHQQTDGGRRETGISPITGVRVVRGIA